ncbi:hypothetical protein HK098_004225 [Nowakowskiella sp. JEL0407]|nr:hypothetical protein HK098_004225 [Nowakowskiella sp. JEL0407]
MKSKDTVRLSKENSTGKSTLSASSPEINDAPIFKNYHIPETETSESTTSINMFAQLHKGKNRITPEENEDVVQHLVSLRLSAPQNDKFANNTEVDLNSTTLAVYDFAGQSQYSVFQQIFITSQAIYLVIFSLDAMFSGDNGNINKVKLQVVLSWLTTIHLRAPEAKILLIGTQADKLRSLDSSYLALLLSYIPSTVKPYLEPNPISILEDPDDIIFATSAKSRTGVKNLRDAIDRAVHSSIEESGPKPVDWIRFQDRIAEMVAAKKCPLMYRLNDLLQITESEFRISDLQELDAVLRYFHTIGVVLYFPQNRELKDVVFPDPQTLVNVISKVFRYNDPKELPTSRQVKPHNRLALGRLKNEKVWMRSLLDELWSRSLAHKDELSSLYALLQEFDLVCDIKTSGAAGVNENTNETIMPCLLPNVDIRTLFRSGNQKSEAIELVLGFDDNVLPAGLYHQIAVRFASNSPKSHKPRVYQTCSCVLVAGREVIIQENFFSGVIIFYVWVRNDRSQEDFEESYSFLTGMIGNVIDSHWSKRPFHYLVPKCGAPSLPPNENVPYGIAKIPLFGSMRPLFPIHCNHKNHGVSGIDIDVKPLDKLTYWFKDGQSLGAIFTNDPARNDCVDLSIDDGKGAIMISYSWGPVDESTKSYPNQERAKRLAFALERNGYKVWIDTRYMRGNMSNKMGTVIKNCKAVIACVSTEYHEVDKNADKEFNYACGLKQKIYGVKLAKNTNMMDGAYEFHKGYKDKFYNLTDCNSGELVKDLNLDGLRIVQ